MMVLWFLLSFAAAYTVFEVVGQLILMLLDLPLTHQQRYILCQTESGEESEFLATLYFFATRPHELVMAIMHQWPLAINAIATRLKLVEWRKVWEKVFSGWRVTLPSSGFLLASFRRSSKAFFSRG